MKKVIYLLTVLIIFSSCDNTPAYKIDGFAEGIPDGTWVKMSRITDYKTVDSVKVENQKFQMQGSVKDAQLVQVVSEQERLFTMMILENADYKLVFDKKQQFADGGEINKIVFGYALEPEYQKLIQENTKKIESLSVDLKNPEKKEATEEKIRKIEDTEWEYRKAYSSKVLEGNHPTLFKVFALFVNEDWEKYDADKRTAMLDQYEKEIGKLSIIDIQREGIQIAKEQEAAMQSTSVGKMFKDIVVKDKDGKEIKLSDIVANNEYTLLDMWASWCKPCRQEFPHLKKAYSEFHDKGFEIYGLSLDKKNEEWIKAINEENIPWINVRDEEGFKGQVASDYGVQGIPAGFLINKKGEIVAVAADVRGDRLHAILMQLFEGKKE